MNHIKAIILLLALLASDAQTNAEQPSDSLVYSLGVISNVSSGRLAPYMIASWNDDRSTMKNSVAIDACAAKPMNSLGRFSWGAGVEFIAAAQHSVDFERYSSGSDSWGKSVYRPDAFSFRRLYAEARYRSLYAMVGMKGFSSKIVDQNLSSGDLVRSNNARPIPGAAIGFTDFQDIPFTNGWIQIDGQIMYGKFTDNRFRRDQFNFYSETFATDLYYTYKYCFFRTKPSRPFSATFGMQTAGQFGGQTQRYYKGSMYNSEVRGFHFKDIFKMFFPTPGNGNGYYEGNSLGAWSLRARYRFKDSSELAVYWENPFEDGSGIACRNGADGLYGIQYSPADFPWIKSFVVEYLDLRNHSGPIHYAPGDHVNPSITSEATGADDYFNNDTFGPYANYGMAIANPMVVSPIYNADGFSEFLYNRMRGAHFAITGDIYPVISYKFMTGWQKGYANGRRPLSVAKTDFSAMIQIDWNMKHVLSGLFLSAKFAFDRGKLRGDNIGAALAVTYSGNLNLKK